LIRSASAFPTPATAATCSEEASRIPLTEPNWRRSARLRAAERAGIDHRRRGETLGLEEFARLAEALAGVAPEVKPGESGNKTR